MSDEKSAQKSIAGLKLKQGSATGEQVTPKKRPRLERSAFPDPAIGNSGPPATIENVEWLLHEHKVTVRYNVIRKRTEILIPGAVGSTDNHDNNAMTEICSLAARHGIPTGPIPAIVEALADRNLYNPVADWIESRPWDGTDRIPDICYTLTTREGFPFDLQIVLIRKWLLSCVAAALKPSGFHARGVLTLQGPQGIGKTSWCRSLIPDAALREEVLKLDHHLDGGSKDSILGAITHWIVEIGELDSSFRRDIARLKGFLTNDRDKVRRPYARAEAEYGRRTVFLATVNQSDFLVDTTGNSRWWTLPVVTIDFNHGIDMQQLFAQLAVRFRAGDQWWLTPEEERELDACNAHHQSFSLIEDALSQLVDWDLAETHKREKFTATELLERAGVKFPTNAQAKECAAILRRHLGEPKRVQGRMTWWVPLRRPEDEDRAKRGVGSSAHRPNKFD